MLIPLAASEALIRLDEFSAIIDARSEGEYAEDRLPGALNWPVLNSLDVPNTQQFPSALIATELICRVTSGVTVQLGVTAMGVEVMRSVGRGGNWRAGRVWSELQYSTIPILNYCTAPRKAIVCRIENVVPIVAD